MQSSEQINELASALSKAQGAVENATKNAQNPHLKNKYADLAAVLAESREPLTNAGLAVVTLPSGHMAEGGVEFVSKLIHASGQWLSTTFVMPLQKRDAQGLGSALTYARRYALSAWLGIAQEDDDGNAASKPAPANDRGDARTLERHNSVINPPGTDDALQAIREAKTLDELRALAPRFKQLPEAAREYVRGVYVVREREINGRAA